MSDSAEPGNKTARLSRCAGAVLLACTWLPLSAFAVDWDVGGFARAVAVATPRLSETAEVAGHRFDSSSRHRLMVTADSERWGFEAHGVVGVLTAVADDKRHKVTIPALGTADVLRWPGLSWGERIGTGHAGLTAELDRLAWTYHSGALDISIGRQPVNLASCLLFTPHDLFAPFSPLDFFRAYKPGVDAVRIDYAWSLSGALSSVRASFVAAAGYRPTDLPDFDATADLQRAVVLGRVALAWQQADIVALAGHAANRWVAGLAMQADLDGWLLRTEQLVQTTSQTTSQTGFSGALLAAGVQRTLTAELSVFAEAMLNYGRFDTGGSGPINPAVLTDYAQLDPWGATGLGGWLKSKRKSTGQGAVAVNWQAHPLLNVQTLLWHAGTDATVVGNYTTFNFSDEGVAAVGGGINLASAKTWYANAEVRWTW